MGFVEDILWRVLRAVTSWDVFHALWVFPLIAVAVRIHQMSGRLEYTLEDRFRPAPGMVRSVASNLGLALLNTFGWGFVFVLYAAVFGGFWTETLGLSRISLMREWWLPLQVLATVAILDLSNYWSHRLLHRPWMWGIHQLHHSDEHMNFTTSYRVHILEAVQMRMVGLITIGGFVLPPEALILAVAFRSWYGMYVHSNLPFDHGRFRKVLASPNYHAWHHCDDPAVYGKNLCDVFPLWDIAFGTHYDPGRCTAPLGVSDAPDDIVAGQLYPFRYWWSLWRGRRRDAALEIETAQREPAA